MKVRRPGSIVIGIGLAAALAVLLVMMAGPRRNQEPAGPGAGGPQTTPNYERIDMHTHVMVGSLPRVVDLMQRYGFHHIVDLSGGTPDTNLEAHLHQAQMSGGRISVFVTMPGRELASPGYGERIASMLARAKEMGVRGFKVSKGLGLGFIDAQGRIVPVDDPGLDPVFDACGRLGLPVAIHTADPKAFWLPPTPENERYAELAVHPEWSFYGQPVPTWEELLNQLERRIARHPGTTFISVHFGNAAEEPERVARMLRKYPNMYIDTAARIPEFGRHPPDRMRDFFIEFQDRILYGSDLGVGREKLDLMLGSTGAEPPTNVDVERFFSSSYRYFETFDRSFESPTPIQGSWTISGVGLPKDVLHKIYSGNAKRVLGL